MARSRRLPEPPVHIEQRVWRWLKVRAFLMRVKWRDATVDVGTSSVLVIGVALPWFWAAIWLSGWPVSARLALTGLSFVVAGLALFAWGWWLDGRQQREEERQRVQQQRSPDY